MIKVNSDMFLHAIEELKVEIASVQQTAKNEAHDVAIAKNWNEDLENKFVEFLLANDERFDVAKKQEKLDFMQKFVEEVPDVEDTVDENAEVQI